MLVQEVAIGSHQQRAAIAVAQLNGAGGEHVPAAMVSESFDGQRGARGINRLLSLTNGRDIFLPAAAVIPRIGFELIEQPAHRDDNGDHPRFQVFGAR
jgi:hypothetical protein